MYKIKENLYYILKKFNIKQYELAKILNVGESTISNYLNEEKEYKPQIKILTKLSEYTDYSINDLLYTDLSFDKQKYIKCD